MLLQRSRRVRQLPAAHPLASKKVWVPRMSYGSARAFAAAFRSVGVDADCTPPPNERTRELGAKYTSGDECYPTMVTLGDFLKVLEQPGVDPKNTVFFLPTAQGPCRFGQYAPLLKSVLSSIGYPEVTVLSPTSGDGYSGMGEVAGVFVRSGWRALVAGDILMKLLLKTRPYEVDPGSADAAYEESVTDLCDTLEIPYPSASEQMEAMKASLVRTRNRFRLLPVASDTQRLLVGVVGEIFCRLNTFCNEEIIRRLEEFGAEAWMSDISEWVWYTNAEQARRLRLEGRWFTVAMLGAKLRGLFQKKDEHELLAPFHEDFCGYEEPDNIDVLLHYAEPYLPPEGVKGEMVLNIGKTVYLAKKGVDGILDISPFTCMNGIVCEAIYPKVSSDLGNIPIRNFYFDGTQSDLVRDNGIYLELARTYRARRLCATARAPSASAVC